MKQVDNIRKFFQEEFPQAQTFPFTFKDSPVADRLSAKAEASRKKSKVGENLVSKDDAEKIQKAVNGLTDDSNHNSEEGELAILAID